MAVMAGLRGKARATAVPNRTRVVAWATRAACTNAERAVSATHTLS